MKPSDEADGRADLTGEKSGGPHKPRLRSWEIVAVVGMVLIVLGSTIGYPWVRRLLTPNAVVSSVPFSFDIVLKTGDGYRFVLPNGKRFAVWRSDALGRALLEYGENLFERPKFEQPRRPSGPRTNGEQFSYIRPGVAAYLEGAAEYSFDVDEYHVSLLARPVPGQRGLSVTVSIRAATDKERVRRGGEIDFYLKRLASDEPDIQLEAISELQRRLSNTGSERTKRRRAEVIEAIRPLAAAADEKVKSGTVEALLALGDEKMLNDLIVPEPKGKWRTAEGAMRLAAFSELPGNAKICEKVLPFLESRDPELFRFGMAFFSKVRFDPAQPYAEKALQSDRAEIRLYAFRAVLLCSADAAKAARVVETMLDDRDEQVVKDALRNARQYNDRISPDALCKHLKHADSAVRVLAAAALDSCPNPQVIAPLLESTKDDAPAVRAQAAVSLGRIGNPAAYSRLKEMLDDPDETVREWAVSGLYSYRSSNPGSKAEIDELLKGGPAGFRGDE